MRLLLVAIGILALMAGVTLYVSEPNIMKGFLALSYVHMVTNYAASMSVPIPITGLFIMCASAIFIIVLMNGQKNRLDYWRSEAILAEQRHLSAKKALEEIEKKYANVPAPKPALPLMPDTIDIEERLEYLQEQLDETSGMVKGLEESDEYKKRWPHTINELSTHISLLGVQVAALVDNKSTNRTLNDLLARVTSIQELVAPPKQAAEVAALEPAVAQEPVHGHAGQNAPELKVVS